MQLATALAQVCDPETLERLLQIKTLLDSVGGQAYICAFRNKYRVALTPEGDEYLEPLDDVKQPGKYLTDGYAIQYEHIAKINRQAVEQDEREMPDSLPEPEEPPDAAA